MKHHPLLPRLNAQDDTVDVRAGFAPRPYTRFNPAGGPMFSLFPPQTPAPRPSLPPIPPRAEAGHIALVDAPDEPTMPALFRRRGNLPRLLTKEDLLARLPACLEDIRQKP